jgi:hypothetical protein
MSTETTCCQDLAGGGRSPLAITMLGCELVATDDELGQRVSMASGR